MTPDPEPKPAQQNAQEALDSATMDGVLESLFSARPAQYVFALTENGLCIPMPPAVPVVPGQVITGIGSALELVVPADFGLVVDAWERARKSKGAQVDIHLRSDPAQAVLLVFVDVRRRYGVFLAFISPQGVVRADAAAQKTLFRPRLCTMWRDELSVIHECDDAATRILGWTRAELVGKRTLDLIHPEDRPAAIAHWMGVLAHPGADERLVSRYLHRDGRYLWFEVTNHNSLNDPALGRVRSDMFDVSERMEAVEALRASEQLLRRLTEALPLGIAQIDTERRIVYRNERLSDIINVIAGGAIDEHLQVAPTDRTTLNAALAALLSRGEPADIELTLRQAGKPCRCSVGMRALTAQNGAVTGGIVFVGDITERALMREELETRATYDDLTHCYNRASILAALNAVLANPDRQGMGIAVLFVDVDRFKDVNDRYGHAAGDELLRHIAERLFHCVRTADMVGRFGGDEFLMVCPRVQTPELALDMARRAMEAISQRIVFATGSMLPAASIGVAWTNCHVDTDALIASADAAMYESKRGDHRPVLSRTLLVSGAAQ